jgi:hypothetical protein
MQLLGAVLALGLVRLLYPSTTVQPLPLDAKEPA